MYINVILRSMTLPKCQCIAYLQILSKRLALSILARHAQMQSSSPRKIRGKGWVKFLTPISPPFWSQDTEIF